MTDPAGGFLERMRAATAGTPSRQREEIRRIATALRSAIDGLMSTRAAVEALAVAAESAEAVAAALASSRPGPGHGGAASLGASLGGPPDGRTFFDNSPVIGRSNPIAPPVDLQIVDGRVIGVARFGSAYEGPPGSVHGGFVAAAFDDVLGMTQSLSGKPGMTGTLTVRYRRPTPLHTDLRFEGELLRVEGRKIFTAGRLYALGELRAEAEAIFISVDFTRIAAQVDRNGGPGD